MGHAGLRHLQGGASGHRHRASGEPGVPRPWRPHRRGRRVLSRHAGGHRLAHNDDQRTGRRRLGRRRHRGGGGHAGPAGLFPHPRCRRGAPDRRTARGRHRDRLGAHADAAPARGEGRGQVCRVLRTGRRGAAGRRPRDHREYGAGIRRDHGLLPDRRRMHLLPSGDGPHGGAARALRGVLPGAGPVGHPGGGSDRLFAGPQARPRLGGAERGRPEAAAGPDRGSPGSSRSSRPPSPVPSPRTASASRPATSRRPSR